MVVVVTVPLLQIAPNNDNLDADGGAHEDGGAEGDEEDLDVEDVEAQPRGARERPPRLPHADGLAARLPGALAPEGAVEGDDGALVGGQQRGLDAGQDGVGGDDEREGRQHPGDAQGQHLQEVRQPPVEVRHREGVVPRRVPGLDVHQPEQAQRQLLGHAHGEPHGRSRERGGAHGGREGRKAAEERLRARRRDRDVHPGCVELHDGQGRDGDSEDLGQERDKGHDGCEDGHGEVEEHVRAQATQQRWPAAYRVQHAV